FKIWASPCQNRHRTNLLLLQAAVMTENEREFFCLQAQYNLVVTSKNTFPKTRRYGIIESSKDSR
ncbi:MAG: hypothetical protein U0M02_02720, partial [Acutalibacteraceae bacterium]|nr:hypothetical protein [Acutalibacteraceae bacterium]